MNARQAVKENERVVSELFESAKKLAKSKSISISEAIDYKVAAYKKYAKNANEAVAWDIRGEEAKKMITLETSTEGVITLYLNNIYQAYMASECGKIWTIEPISNDIYYKSEIIDEAEFLLPDGFKVKDFLGDKYFYDGVREWKLVTENDLSVSLVSAEGIIELKKYENI